MDPRFIDDLARRLAAYVPESLQAVGRDVEANFRAVLQSGLSRLDLVTRQEFDVQVAVLKRTREKLEHLEQRLAEIEKEAGTS
jgi:BMFP domain-containing protein YqiC